LAGLVYIGIYTTGGAATKTQTVQQIRQRQDALLEAMGAIRVMRRGTVSEQRYAERRQRKGGAGACGPYFLWQGYVRGKRFSERVAPGQAEAMREEMAQAKRFQELCQEYMALGEALAEQARQEPAGAPVGALKKGRKSRSSRASK
jgi:hypothetical protein